MKPMLTVTSAILALGLLVGGVAVDTASAATPLTCAQYMKLSPAHRRAMFARVKASLPTPSLATPTTTTSSGKAAENKPMRPTSASTLVAACQAASPDSTVADAVRHEQPSNTTTNSTSTN